MLNKCEDIEDLTPYADFVCISAKYGQNIDGLKQAVYDVFKERFTDCTLCVPYSEVSEFSSLAEDIAEHSRRYGEDGIEIDCTVENMRLARFKKYIKRA